MVYSSGVWARSLAWMAAWCVPTIRSCPSFRWPGPLGGVRNRRGQVVATHGFLASNPLEIRGFWCFSVGTSESELGFSHPICSVPAEKKISKQPVLELSAQLRVAIRQMQTLHPFFVGVERLVSLGAQLGPGRPWMSEWWTRVKTSGSLFQRKASTPPIWWNALFPIPLDKQHGTCICTDRDSERYVSPCWILHLYILFKYVPSINSQEVSNMSSNTWND